MTSDTTAADDRLWLPDVNVLVALVLKAHLHHAAAHAALGRHDGPWATTPMTESALLRLLLNPSVTSHAFSARQVCGILVGLRRDPRWRHVADDSSLSEPTIDLTVLVGHKQVTDLHLVNLAAKNQALLITLDAAIGPSLAPADRRHVLLLTP